MSNSNLRSTGDERIQAEIVSRHLIPSYTAHLEGAIPDTGQSSATTQSLDGQGQEYESSLKLQGGDIHRDLYKINARASPIQRAHTFSHISRPNAAVQTAVEHRQPGGFRRQFIQQNRRWLDDVTTPITRVLFLPKAFKNGGLLFSTICLITVSFVSYIGFRLLLQSRARYGGGYGDIGEAIGGTKMRSIILSSITISQIGFVCAGIIFTAENMKSFLEAVSGSSSPLSTKAIIGIQIILLIPLAFIRNISHLGGAALLADICILFGLGYIYYFDISTLAMHSVDETVQLFNPRDFALTIGSAIFTFEGIGLILPVQSSMKHQQKFESLLFTIMLIITIIFTSMGALCYATFGDKTSVEIISNLPQDDKLVNAVQFLYSLAVLVGIPVQLFPAMRIVEGSLFGRRSGRRDRITKWKKNAFRTSIVCGCGLLSALGSADLDKFVALIGSFACVPLVYIYPAYLHWKGVADNKYAKTGDILLMGIGLVAMIYTTIVTVVRWTD
ncbi:hypothetical protein ACLOAV_004862 [Pseudogymnoascus australis]